MAEGLQYKIGADVTDLQKGIDAAVTSINKLDKASTGVSKSMQTIKAGAAAATPSLNALSQVARDLPFGFIAIQNNLPILFDQFTSLSSKSGGVSAALKGIGGALLGPAGVAFGIGAVISGITVLTQKYGSLGAAFSNILGLSNAVAESNRQLAASITKVAAETAGEAAKVNSLVSIMNDANSTNQQRVEVYKRIKSEYPGLIQNMSQENALTKQGGDLIAERAGQLIKYINLKGREKALTELISKATEKQLSTLDDLNQLGTIDAVLQGLRSAIQGAGTLGNPFGAAFKDISKAGSSIQFFNKGLRDTQKEIALIDPDIFKFKAEKVGKVETKTGKVDPIKIPVIPVIDKREFATIDFTSFFSLDQNQLRDKVKLFADKTLTAYNEAMKTAGKVSGKFELVPSASVQAGITAMNDLKLSAMDTVEAFNTFLAPAVDTVFGAIANGSNVFDALKQSLRAMVAQFVVAIAKALILAGILSIINPAGAAAGGMGKGFGAIFGNLFKQFAGLPKFAEGGIVSRPTFGMFGEAGPEAVMPLDKLNSMLGNFGGGGNMQVSGAFSLRGNDLLASIERTKKQQGRAF